MLESESTSSTRSFQEATQDVKRRGKEMSTPLNTTLDPVGALSIIPVHVPYLRSLSPYAWSLQGHTLAVHHAHIRSKIM
jgi:hypothetical protein